MTVRIGINGLGRIGRNALRVVHQLGDDIEVVAANDLAPVDDLAMLVKYDTVLGPLDAPVKASGHDLLVGDRAVRVLSEKDPAALPWADLGVDVVVECTGRFNNGTDARKHLDAGARKVVLSAPGKHIDATFVLGVNDDSYEPDTHHIVSNASCTTNCLAPLAKVLHEEFGIVDGIMTTIHAYTADQNLQDGYHKKDRRRARAAAANLIPTSTGAAKAIGEVIPELKGRLDGFAMRVPVITGSATDLTVELHRHAEVEEVNDAFRAAAGAGPLAEYLRYSEDPLVSSDIVGDPHSAIFDAPLTKSIGQTVKVIAWYDNEWGYSNRLIDLTRLVGTAR